NQDPSVGILEGRKISCEDREAEVETYQMATLSPYQYLYTLEDLIGRPLNSVESNLVLQAAAKSPLSTSENGFDNHTRINLSPDFADSKIAIGEVYAQILKSQVISGCNDQNCVSKKLGDFLEKVMPKIYPISSVSELKSKLLLIFNSSYSLDADLDRAVSDSLTALFSSPSFHIKSLGSDSGNTMSATEVGRKLSYFLLSSLPDDLLVKDIESGEILKAEKRAQHVTRILSEASSLRRFSFQFLSQFLGFNGSYHTSSQNMFNNMNEKDIYDSEILFFEYVLKNNLPIGHLIESGVIFANKAIANQFDLAGGQGTGFLKYDSDIYTGLLSHPVMFMKTFKQDEKKLYVSRGARVQERFICQVLPKLSQATIEELAKVEQELKDRGVTSVRDSIEFHRSNPACYSCHQHIDGFGIALEKFDGFGHFRSEYPDGAVVDASGSLLKKNYSDHSEMFHILKESYEYKSCFVKQMNALASQRDFYKNSDCLVVDVISKAGENMPLRNLIEGIVSSVQFVRKRQ
ncbi:MAG: DUF1588 domain-containing protein, partial [Bdellovibrionales bacterium]|nr:DUF1588 domain-containing protein [Bdellovibrionales bacterium]